MAKQDTMTKDIRKNIAEVFGRVPKYATGVGKLFLASGKEIFNIEMPYIGAMYETNQDLLKEVIRTLRNPADAINKQVNRALQSETAVELQKFGKYLIDDLKSGNLYDENRMRSVGGSVEDMLSEFGGFDMDGFDESGEWDDSSFDDSGSETDIKIAEVQEENANKRTGAVIDAIATSTEATVVNANANAQANLRTSMKQHAQQMNGMQNLITTQSATFELINKSINAQLDVTREAHQQVMGKFDEITALLTEIRDGVNPPKQVEKEREQEEIFGAHGALNIANYLKQVIKNIDDKFQISNTISMGTAGASPAQLIQMASDNPLTLITDQILNKVIKKEWREQMAKTNKNLSSLGPALLQKLFTKGRDYQYADEKNNSGIGGLLASLFGVTQRSRSAIDIAYKDPLAATQFNMKTSRAIEEVIPMWLSKIYSAISGDPLMIYNYSTGKLEKVADVISTNYKNARDLAGKMGDTEYEIDRRVEYFKFKDSVDKEDFRNFTYRFLQKYAESGEFIDPHMSRDKFKETFSSLSSGFKNIDNQYYALFTAILKSLPDNVRLGMAKDMAEARETRNSNNSKINNALKESGLGAAFSGFIDPKLESEIQRLTMNGRRTLTGEDLQDNLDQYKAKLKIKTGTAGTNSLLTDILSTLRKGLITYSYSVGAIDDSSPNNEILKLVQKGADDQKKYDDVVKKYHDDIEARKQKRKEDEHKKFVEEGQISHYADKIQVTENIDPSIAEVIQHLANVDNMPKSKVDNKVSEAHARWFEGRKDSVKKLISEVGDATGATSLIKTLQKVAEEPFKLFDEGLKLADAFMLKLVFGEDSIASDDPNKEPNLMDTISKSLRIHFLDAKNWFKSEIANPMHDILLDKDEGVLPRISKAVGELFGFKDGKNPIKDTVNKLEERFLGNKVEEKDENGKVISSRREGGKFSNQMNRLHDKTNELKSGTKAGVNDFVTRLLYGDYGTTKGVGTYMDLDDNGNVVAGRAYGGAIGWFKKIGTDFREMMLGPDGEETDSKNKWKTVTGELHKAYPDMIVGGGVGLLASLFLPGGPILGTIVGSTAGLVHGSDKLSEFLFGKFSETEDEIVRDKDGNPVIDRKTGKPKMRKTQTKSGLLDRDLVDGFKQFFPGIAIGAGAGGLIGSIGLLPFGLGGAAGTVIGGVTGMLASSDQVKTLIFGEFGDDDSGLISKNFRKKVVETVKKYAPPVLGLGAAGGALGNLLGAGLGLIPGLSLLPTGPIFGIMGALMGVANADQINKFLFGDEVEETTEVDDGKGGKKKVTHKKREGGIFGGIHDFARDKIITPLGNKFNEVGYKVQGWFQESIITPLRNSMEPLKNRMREAGEKIFGSMKNIGEKITESIFKVFNISLNGDDGEGGLKAWFHDKVLKRLDNMANKIFDTIGLILGKIIAAPFKAFEMLVTGKIGDRTEDDLADAASDKRKNKRDARREKQREAMLGRASKNLNKSGGFLHNLWTRITGKDKEESKSTAADISGSSTTESGSITTQVPGSPAYSAAANGITNPDQLRDVAQQVVNESRTNNRNDWDNQDKYGNTNGIGTRPDRTQVPSLSESMTSAAKPSADDASKTKAAGEARGEEETRKKTTRSIGAKTNNEYLREIAKSTTGIYSEIKGQLGGTGWNVAYIKAMLDKQFQPLSDDELPEEMEGSKKVKKRRGLLGKAKDAVFGFAGAAKDKIVGIASKVVDVVSAPFKLIAKVVIGAKDAIKSFVGGLWDGIKQIGGLVLGAAKTIGDILREIGIGFAEGVGEVLRGAGELIHKAAGGIGEAIGNIASTLTGVLHDTTLALSSAALGLFQTAAAIAPDIALGLWDGAKWLGGTAIKGVKGAAKFVWKGMKKAGRGVKKGVSWIFGKITGRGKHKDEDGDSNGYNGSSISVDGGYLDSVNSITNNVPVAVGGNANIPFPVVSVTKSKLSKAFGTSFAIPVYLAGLNDLLVLSTKDATARVTNNKEEKEDSDRFKSAYKEIDRKAEKAADPKEEYDKAMAKANTPEEREAIIAAEQLNQGSLGTSASPTNSGEEKSNMFTDMLKKWFGFESDGFGSKILGLLKGTNLAAAGTALRAGAKALGSAGTATVLGNLPFIAGTVTNAKNGNWDRVRTNILRQGTGRFGQWLTKSANGALDIITSPEGATLGKNAGNIGAKLIAGIKIALEKFINSNVMKHVWTKFPRAEAQIRKIFISNLDDAIMKLGSEAAGKFLSKLNIAVMVATAVFDFTSGFSEAGNYFDIANSDVTVGMRFTAGIAKALSGLAWGLIPVNWLGQSIYKIFAGEDASKELTEKQTERRKLVEEYNTRNGTNLTVSEYYDEENPGFFKKLSNSVTTLFRGAEKNQKTLIEQYNEVNGTTYTLDGLQRYQAWSGKSNVRVDEYIAECKRFGYSDWPKDKGNTSSTVYYDTSGITHTTQNVDYSTWSANVPIFRSDNAMETGKGPGELKLPTYTGTDFNAVGYGIGQAFVDLMSEVSGDRISATGLFNLIGEGLGNSLLDDLRKTEGNKANLNTVMTNAVGTSMQTAVKNSNSEPWYKKAAGAVKDFFSWGKGTEDTDKTEWGTGVKPMSQKDTRWNQSDSKMATTGCGPTAAAIVASKYDKNANPAEANAASRNLGMRASDGGTNPAFFGQYASRHGYGMRQGPVDSGSIQSNLRSNQPVVVMGKGGAFGNNMHYMVADRTNNNGTVGLIDPLSGGRRSTTMDDLMANTKNAIYSFGKGPVTPEDKKASAESSSGISTSEAQQKLVQKMEWLSQHPIRYSLEGSQDPDKGSASCASTVGWAYRKVFGQELNGMSASSKEQAKDSRFTTIWGNPANEGTQPGKLLDFSIMQPGDIVYMKNPTSNHTEMYAGNGMNWSHGGPEDGPTLRPLDEKRQKRVWAINRYTPFLNGQPVQVHEGQLISKGSSGAAASGTAAGVAAGSGSLSELFTPDGASGGYTASGLLNAFLGIGSVIGSGISNALTMLLGGTVSDTENGSTSSVAGIAKNSGMKKSTTGNVPYTESNLTRDESKKTIWKFLHDQGFNDIGASGVMGCWQEESYNTANRVEGDYLPQYPGAKTVLANNQSLNDYTTKILFPAYANSKPPYKVNKEAYKGNDGNYYPGFGLAQWTGPRGYDMIKYAESQGKDWRDIRTQLEFAATEMNTRGLADIVNSATDPAEAAHKVLDHYEMYVGYGDNNPKELNKRTAHANAIYNLFSAEGSEPSEDVDAEDDDLGDKKNRPSDVKAEWGTGPSATLSALNDKIQNINRMFTSMREETAEDTTIAQVTGKLTEAINNVSNPTSSDSEQMMKIMAQSLATMVELLTAIKENTTPKKEAQPESTPQSKKLPVAKAKAFDDESGVGTNDRDIGASIIDVLTSK